MVSLWQHQIGWGGVRLNSCQLEDRQTIGRFDLGHRGGLPVCRTQTGVSQLRRVERKFLTTGYPRLPLQQQRTHSWPGCVHSHRLAPECKTESQDTNGKAPPARDVWKPKNRTPLQSEEKRAQLLGTEERYSPPESGKEHDSPVVDSALEEDEAELAGAANVEEGLMLGGTSFVNSVADANAEAVASGFRQPHVLRIPVGDREITLETGKVGRLANGAVTIRDGDTVLYATACASRDPSEPGDFVPFTVNYQERFSAAGRTSGGFIKREGRAKDHEVLVCRLIDRPLRPMLSKDFPYETQLLLWVLSYDGVHPTEPIAITAAGAALAISDIPIAKPVAGVRVGMVNGEFVVNPSVQEMKSSPLDMVIGGTAEAVLMIEGYCDFFTDEQLLEAVAFGHAAVSKICVSIEEWAKQIGKPKKSHLVREVPESIPQEIKHLCESELRAALMVKSKQQRGALIEGIEGRVLQLLTSTKAARDLPTSARSPAVNGEDLPVQEDEDEEDTILDGEVDEGDVHVRSDGPVVSYYGPAFETADVKRAFKEVTSGVLREMVVRDGVRSDGRTPMEIRPIDSSCGILPCVHGSALFTRGETQAIVVTTLGGEDMGQRVDNLTQSDETKRFYLQYSFPPSSVGEVGKLMGATRRELGHGMLAERALQPVIPSKSAFPYVIRVESTITESNGSSSMASVCGGCLALLDAGVPLKRAVAGVAMGLILDTRDCGGDGEPLILTDILGSEDALGDMDFKVAGDSEGVTAFQMDIKVEGITLPVMAKALAQAREGRRHVLGEMAKAFPPPSGKLSKYAPRMKIMQIPPAKVTAVIGSGGKTIRSIIEDSGVESIDIEQDGSLLILGKTDEGLEMASERIIGLTMVPEVGAIYRNCVVKSVMLYGCFVEIAPGKEGLVHISELHTKRLEKVEDYVNKGDVLDVKLTEINARGQLRLSHKAVLLEREQQAAASTGGQEQSIPEAVTT